MTTTAGESTPGGKCAATLSVLDQGVSSATNFGSTIAAAMLLSATGFGEFSVAYVAFLIALGALQAFIGQDLVLRVGSQPELEAASRGAIRFGLVSSLPVAGLTVLVVGLLIPEAVPAMIPMACLMPALAGHELLRFAASLQKRMHIALVIDLSWLVLAAVPLGWMVFARPEGIEPWMVSLIWASAGAVSFIVGSVLMPWFRGSAVTVRHYLSANYLGRRFLLEFLVARGASQSLSLALGALVGTRAAGSYRGASTLLGPVTVLLGAVSSFGAPILRSVPQRERIRWLARLSVGLGALALLWTTALVLTPDSIGRIVLGDTWAGARELLLPLGLQTVALAAGVPFFMGTRVSWPRLTLWLQLGGSVAMVGLFLGGVWAGGVVAAAWGQFLASALLAIAVIATYVVQSRRPPSHRTES